jgi:hypothetical protein
MDTAERAQFVRGYTKVLTSAWSDEAFMNRLKSDPKDTLAEYGLDSGDAAVSVVTEIRGEGSLDEQVELWDAGKESGTIQLFVPDVPQVGTEELSDEQLESVSAGDTYCCCCSPCCTCT